ncbi:MAG: thiolase [Pseudomonadota bacterium]
MSERGEGQLRGAASIVGVGICAQWEAKGRTVFDQMGEAVAHALEDAGLKLSDVDGLFAGAPGSFLATLEIGEYLGIQPRFASNNMVGGSSFVGHLLTAAMALHTRQCDVALICYGSAQRSQAGGLVSVSRMPPYEELYRPRYPMAQYALAARRHMHEYGTTREHLAHVAVSARQWATLNPEAFMRAPMTVEEALAARMICDPLTVRDACLVTDGGGAVILTRPDRARDLRQAPIHLLGAAAAQSHYQIDQMPDLTTTSAASSGARAFAMAGLTPADVDVIELYDAFTINTILFLEDLGFCAKGEGGPFVAEGRIAPGGSLPVNTNGGGLSCNHPGMYGIFTIIEAVRQLRGEAGARQVADAQVALCHGNGGVLSSQITALLGTTAAL